MAFGQQSGPPSSAKQVEEIAQLLESAGFSSFREARHPYGLSQRQASGKFTQGEAAELIERLQSELADADSDDGPRPAVDHITSAAPIAAAAAAPNTAASRAARREADRQAEALVGMPDVALADELARRGWICMPPA